MNDVTVFFRALGVLVSCISATIALIAAYRTRIAVRQSRELQILGIFRQYQADLRGWADEVVDALTESAFLCELDPARMPAGEFFARRHGLRTRLSALTDRGRWFLPNEDPDVFGQEKESAFRGFRHAALDQPVFAIRILETLDHHQQSSNRTKKDHIVETKRTFVSELQHALDPRGWRQQIAQLKKDIAVLPSNSA